MPVSDLLASFAFRITMGTVIVSVCLQYRHTRKTKRHNITLWLRPLYSTVLPILSVLNWIFDLIKDVTTSQVFFSITCGCFIFYHVRYLSQQPSSPRSHWANSGSDLEQGLRYSPNILAYVIGIDTTIQYGSSPMSLLLPPWRTPQHPSFRTYPSFHKTLLLPPQRPTSNATTLQSWEWVISCSPPPGDIKICHVVEEGFYLTDPIAVRYVRKNLDIGRPCIIASAEVEALLSLQCSPSGTRGVYCVFSLGSMLIAKSRRTKAAGEVENQTLNKCLRILDRAICSAKAYYLERMEERNSLLAHERAYLHMWSILKIVGGHVSLARGGRLLLLRVAYFAQQNRLAWEGIQNGANFADWMCLDEDSLKSFTVDRLGIIGLSAC